MEIIGKTNDNRIILKQHQAKDNEDLNKFFTVPLEEEQCWLPNEFEAELI